MSKDIEDKGEIIKIDESNNSLQNIPTKRLERFVPKVLTGKEKSVLKALKKYRTNISLACEACRISRTKFNNMKKNPLFQQAVEDEVNAVDDLLESSALRKALEDGDTQMMIFLMKTRMKHRGYVERTEQLVQSNQKVVSYDVKDMSDEQLDRLLEKDTQINGDDP